MSYEELQRWGLSTYDITPDTHHSFKTKRAKIDIFTNCHFGRMLFIDGTLQSSESDEKIYHEAIVGLAGSVVRSTGSRVLIIGGSEGAVAREVLKLPCVKEVVMVDWDYQLVMYMRTCENFHKGAFEDPRLKLVYLDVVDHLSQDLTQYDSIILDLLDPELYREADWLAGIVKTCLGRLKMAGTIVCNAGGCRKMVDRIVDMIYKGSSGKVHCSVHQITVPSFQETWYLIKVC
jgi:spermidine synthase